MIQVYVLLKSKAKVKGTSDEDIQPGSSTDNQKQVKESNQGDSSALQLLADVATGMIQDTSCKMSETSPVMKEALKLPKAATKKVKRKSTLDELPDHLTSPECIRKLEVKSLVKIRKFAGKEKKAKIAYLKAKSSGNPTVKGKSSVNAAVKGKPSVNESKGKATVNAAVKGKSSINAFKGKAAVTTLK